MVSISAGEKYLGECHVGDHMTILQESYAVTFGFDIRIDSYFFIVG